MWAIIANQDQKSLDLYHQANVMTKNKVFINKDGVVEIHVVGDQTVESVQAMGEQALKLSQQQREARKPALILDNLLQMGSVPPEARKTVADLVKSYDYDKLAMLGSGGPLKFGANLILQATRRGARVKYFDDRKKCDAWLLS
jgi:hypothetical protein